MNTLAVERKKQIEKNYLEEARRASPIFPAGDFLPYEKPDFLLRLDDRTIGIEVTELCREAPRAEASRLAKIPQEAKVRYSRLSGSEPVALSIGFSRRAADITFEQLTSSLVEFAYARRKSRGTCPARDLPEGYRQIGIHSPIQQIDPTGRWYSLRAFDTVIAPKQLIESRIAKKTARLAEYRLASPEVWLLIVSDQFLGPGQVCVHPDHLSNWKFSFEFEKVLLFARVPGGRNEVFELEPV